MSSLNSALRYITIGNSITRATTTTTTMTTTTTTPTPAKANATRAFDTVDCSNLNSCSAFEDLVVIYFPTRNVSYVCYYNLPLYIKIFLMKEYL